MIQTTSFGIVSIAVVTLASACLCARTAHSAPNGYTQIPIAKVFGNGVAAFSYSVSRLGYSAADETTQYGLFNRFEVGVDYQSAPDYDRSLHGNAKYLLVHEPGHLPDVAAGMTNIARHQRADPYLVATTQPGAFGVSLGLTRPTAGGFVGMGGAAYNLNPNTQFVADYVDGRAAYTTVGVNDAVTPTVSVNFAYARPNAGGGLRGIGAASAATGFVVNVAYVFHAHHGKGDSGNGGGNKNPTAAGTGGGGG